MAATATATRALKLSNTSSNPHRLNPTKKLIGSTKFLIQTSHHSSASYIQRPFTIQASNNPKIEDRDSSIDTDDSETSSAIQEELPFLWKLGVGSFVGAAVIKYGSILFPDIAKPNILQALVMISTPVAVAIWLLIKQSRVEQRR